jgi:type IV secretory pathway VirB10-like protein
MNFSLIYSKTAKGAAEIAARSGALTPAMRRVLIMVDGRRTAAELELVARDGEFESIIAALLEKGMIEQTGTVEAEIPDWVDDEEATVVMESPRGPDAIPALRAAPQPPAATQAAAAPAPAPAPAPVEPKAPSLEERKRMAVRALYDRLGPYGEEPAARIQECKSFEELGEKLKHACRRIALFRGEQAAREYMASIGQV